MRQTSRAIRFIYGSWTRPFSRGLKTVVEWFRFGSIQGFEPMTSGLRQRAANYTTWILRLLSFGYSSCTTFTPISSTPFYYHCAVWVRSGRGRIRTFGPHIAATGRFKTGAINHSATLPLKMSKNRRIFDSSPPLHWLGLPICPVKDWLTTSGLTYWSCVPSVGLEPTRISPLIPEISLYYLFQHKGISCPPGETRTLTFSRTSRPKRDACCQFRHRRSCFH